jgi:RHH-type rel operon transcriptional repressor/antitoxin RelB
MMTLRLSSDIEGRLKTLALKTGRTKTFYVRQAIQEHLEDLEDTFLAQERLLTQERIWSHEEVVRDVNMEN